MSYKLRAWVSYNAITALVSKCASDRDRDGKFPHSAFDGLRQLRLISQPPLDAWNSAILFRILAAVGRGDLSVGRIFEGHVNALLLIRLFGTTGNASIIRAWPLAGVFSGFGTPICLKNPCYFTETS